MKLPILLLGVAFGALALVPSTSPAAPKKLLVVNQIGTGGFSHSVIPTSDKVLMQLAESSQGLFTVDLLVNPADRPVEPRKPGALKPNATEEQKAAYEKALATYNTEAAAMKPAKDKWEAACKEGWQKLSAENLQKYDGVVINNATGVMPFPDREGFIKWVKSGKAVIGLHAATDCFHNNVWPEYTAMWGGAQFKTHAAQLPVSCINVDAAHPANKHLGKTLEVPQEEIYQFNGYDPKTVHELLVLDKKPDVKDPAPGHYPISWCLQYGAGKVFYTSLGHREDVVSTDPNLKDRKNPVDLSKAYQAHLLGGIKWALGLEPGDATPQTK